MTGLFWNMETSKALFLESNVLSFDVTISLAAPLFDAQPTELDAVLCKQLSRVHVG